MVTSLKVIFLSFLLLFTTAATAQDLGSVVTPMMTLAIAGILGLVSHTLKELIGARTMDPAAFNSYFSGNWPQLGLALVSTAAIIYLAEELGGLTKFTAYLAGLSGGSLSAIGGKDWGELKK